MAFSGSFWLGSDSLELKRLTSESKVLPAESGACESASMVDYQKLTAGTGTYLLPQQSTTKIAMQDGTETQMTADYSDCREYSSEATIHFDGEGSAAGTKAAAAATVSLPAGVEISIALTQPIDTDTAAAGDLDPNLRKGRSPRRGC